MTGSFVPVRHIAALSVAITLCAAPIASAQSPEAAAPAMATASTALLSPVAFARLVKHPPEEAVPAPVVMGARRLGLLHYGTTAMVRQALVSTPGSQQKSSASHHKKAIIVASVIAGAVALGLTAWWIASDHFCC
jgi:hypothetical protein